MALDGLFEFMFDEQRETDRCMFKPVCIYSISTASYAIICINAFTTKFS
jgi:hypothetical protein